MVHNLAIGVLVAAIATHLSPATQPSLSPSQLVVAKCAQVYSSVMLSVIDGRVDNARKELAAAKASDVGVAEAAARLEGLTKERAMLRSGHLFFYVPSSEKLALNDGGRVYGEKVKVIQVLSDREALIRWGDRVLCLASDRVKNLSDDESFELDGLIAVTRKKTYTAVSGAKSTVLVIEEVDDFDLQSQRVADKRGP